MQRALAGQNWVLLVAEMTCLEHDWKGFCDEERSCRGSCVGSVHSEAKGDSCVPQAVSAFPWLPSCSMQTSFGAQSHACCSSLVLMWQLMMTMHHSS